jgi:glycosyltransferase involved in cell wall biosynthesis
MKLRVAFILPSYEIGGSQRVLLTLFRALNRDLMEPHLFVFDDQGVNGGLAHLVEGLDGVHILGQVRLRSAVLSLFREIREIAPDVVFSTMGYVNLAVLAMSFFPGRHVRTVIRESNTPSLGLPGLRYSGVIRLGYRCLYPFADAVISQSRIMGQELIEDFGVAKERLFHIPNPVDIDRVRDAASRISRFPGTGRRFVASGHLIHQKGFDQLIELIPSLNADDHLTILGDGEERKALEQLIARLNLNNQVLLKGFVDNPWQYYAGADAFLMPSRWEGLPNASLEALACGTPVIATPQTGGLVEVLEVSSDGALTVVEMESDFADALTDVQPVIVDRPRPSLLPDRYNLEMVMTEYTSILLGDGT